MELIALYHALALMVRRVIELLAIVNVLQDGRDLNVLRENAPKVSTASTVRINVSAL